MKIRLLKTVQCFLSLMHLLFVSIRKMLSAQPFCILVVSFLGLVSLLKNLSSLVKWIYKTLFRPTKDLKEYGSWALITGSTDGIGKAFAFELAGKGLNLVLVSRSWTKLKTVSSEIRDSVQVMLGRLNKTSVQVMLGLMEYQLYYYPNRYPATMIKLLELDFSENDVVSKIKDAIEGVDIGVLINNVGVTYPRAMYFHEVDEKIWMNLVRVNVEGTTYVTKAVVPGMVARGRGAIVNIGSGASVVVPSHPLYAIYAATKAFVDQLSRSLYVEYKQYGIHVQCQVPLYVSTKMASRVAFVEKPSIFIPSAEAYVEAAVGFIGHDEARCTPYWAHSLQWFFASLLPQPLLDSWRLSIGIKRMKI